MYIWGISTPEFIILAILLFLILVFEVWMFVSVIFNPKITRNRRLLWIIGMIILHPFVAIIYFITDYQKLSS